MILLEPVCEQQKEILGGSRIHGALFPSAAISSRLPPKSQPARPGFQRARLRQGCRAPERSFRKPYGRSKTRAPSEPEPEAAPII
jgi:hypothetical protein